MDAFQELKNRIDKYMLMADPGIIKLLLAFCVGCKLPLPPPWLFIVSGSGGGKTKLIQLLEMVPGYFEVDEMTTNTLLSGAKRHDGSASMLHKLKTDGFLVFKDFTSMLSKHKEDLTAIIGQLRMVYDGKMVKETGQGESITYRPPKAPGLLAAVTTKIFTTSRDWGEMGERFAMYHMDQPDNVDVGWWIMDSSLDEKAIEAELRDIIQTFLAGIKVAENPKELPELDQQTKKDLIEIAYLTVMSRSAVERNQWDRKQRVELIHDHEMIGRFLKQLKNLAYGFIYINGDGQLRESDRKILYKIGLDSIPKQRRLVMRMLTANRLGGDMNQIADFLHLEYDTVNTWVGDLVALGIVHNDTQYYGGTKKKHYSIEPKYMDIISKFEGIVPEERALPESEDKKAEASSVGEPPPEQRTVEWSEIIK